MYIAHKCKKCGREFLLLEEDLNKTRHSNREVYIVCSYCSSRDIKVTGKYSDLEECMNSARIYKRKNGRLRQIK